jgi:hypothetical protein
MSESADQQTLNAILSGTTSGQVVIVSDAMRRFLNDELYCDVPWVRKWPYQLWTNVTPGYFFTAIRFKHDKRAGCVVDAECQSWIRRFKNEHWFCRTLEEYGFHC